MGHFFSNIKSVVLLSCFFLFSFSFAGEVPVSAIRGEGESWQQALMRELGSEKTFSQVFYHLSLSDLESETSAIPEWNLGMENLNELNRHALGVRPYDNPNASNFKRRAPWLYPVDGCYAKAAHISAEAIKRKQPKPGKIYAYGDLEFPSPYAMNGRVAYWTYHVAAAYRVDGVVYVVDPIINQDHALPQEEWLKSIAPMPETVRIVYCDSHSYSPSGTCRGGPDRGAYLGHMKTILSDEWENLMQLGFEPTKLLAPQ